MKKLLLLLALSLGTLVGAQNITVTGDGNYTGCVGNLLDSGGNGGNYGNSEDFTYTICSDDATQVTQLNFIQFDLELNVDYVYIYDGDSDVAPLLGVFTGAVGPGVITATANNTTGCLTVRIITDATNTAAGFRAVIQCVAPCQAVSASIDSTVPAPDADGIIRICQGDTVTFTGSGTFGVDGTGATYTYEFDNNTSATGTTATGTFPDGGAFEVELFVRDAAGCRNTNRAFQIVQVSTTPDFTGTAAVDNSICLGDSTDITAMAVPVPYIEACTPPVSGTTFLPDGSGVSYSTCINVSCFDNNLTLTTASQLQRVFMNIEHSYMGDLDIQVTAPNGVTIDLFTQANGGTFLGDAFDNNTGTPGIGNDYGFTEGPTATVLMNAGPTVPTNVGPPNVSVGNKRTPGDYLPEQGFAGLVGSSLNGTWCLTITDNIGIDDGYIFNWGIELDPNLIPSDLSFTPTFTSEQWLPDPTITATNGNTITVLPTMSGQNCYTYEVMDDFGCTYTETVCITVGGDISNGAPVNLTACDDGTGSAIFDLTQNDANIQAGLTPADYPVSYYTSQMDADNGTNPIGTPTAYASTSNPQTIYARLDETATACFTTYTFDIALVPLPVANTAPTLTLCDDVTNDGVETFNLDAQTTVILGAQDPTLYTVSYFESQADADADTNPIASPAAYDNLANPQTIYARLSDVSGGCFVTTTFVLIVNPQPVAGAVMNIEICDDPSNDGVEMFDLSALDATILGTQNPADFTIGYFLSQADAVANMNAIANPAMYTNTAPTETIFIRLDGNLFNGCTDTLQSFDIVVSELPVGNPVPDQVVCDDLTNDGTEVFDLSADLATLLGAQAGSGFDITYHTSQADADANTNAIATPAGYNNVSSPETIFVRIENPANTTCADTTINFDLVVNPAPVAGAVADIAVCDDGSNDGTEVFDLSALDATILGAQNAADFTIGYFLSQADADSNMNAIATPAAFSNTASPQTIFVRLEGNPSNGCVDTLVSFDLIVNESPNTVPVPDQEVCDDASNDGTEIFDLTADEATLLGAQAGLGFSVTYYTSQADADAATNAIATPAAYSNVSSPETIFIRVENPANTTCPETSQSFTLTVQPQPVANAVADIVVCDDASNDGTEAFDLTAVDATVLGSQPAAGFTVQYFLSQADADSNMNAIATPAAFNNTASPQTIFVRLEGNNASGCVDTLVSFDLIVDTLPTSTAVTGLENCDDASNDGSEVFDLTQNEATLIGAQNPADVTVTYYTSQADADSGTNGIASPVAFANTVSPQTIFVRVENNGNASCADTATSFDIIVNPVPAIVMPSDLQQCDDPSGDGVESFDLSSNDMQLLNGLNPADYAISYYATLADAQNKTNPLPTIYNNTAAQETIFVCVEDLATGCTNLTEFDILLDQVPVFTAVDPLLECDDDADGVATFDLLDREDDLINGQSDVFVTYHATAADAATASNPLASMYDNTSNPQTIFVRLERGATGCFTVGDFTIEAVGAPIPVAPALTEQCDDDQDGQGDFDLDALSVGIAGGQANTTVTYYATMTDADLGMNAIASPFTTPSTTVFARLSDDLTDCFNVVPVVLQVNPLPQPALDAEYVICILDGVLTSDPALLDTGLTTANYSFQWTLDGAALAGETDGVLIADAGGSYGVTVTDLTTGCENSQNTTVRVSGPPANYAYTITPYFDDNYTVTVTADGPDEYWFAIDDGPFQDRGLFEPVAPGPHTLTIAERTGCGQIVVDIYVVGYPRYFTPNSDGINDTWNIVGGTEVPGSKLYIFDRFGKLIKEIDPQGAGWDGTYNGTPLPSSDYWFQVEYEQNGIPAKFRSHFSLKR